MFFSSLISLFLWFRVFCVFLMCGSTFLACSFFFPIQKIQPLARFFCRMCLWAAGQKIDVVGSYTPNTHPRIYMFNHTSLLDTFICIAVIEEWMGAVGKKEQFRIPIWGSILRKWGAVPLDRQNLSKAKGQLNDVVLFLQAGNALLIAPEGTRSPTESLQTLKKGPFHVAVQSKAHIIPVHISGAFYAKNIHSWILRPHRILVSFREPIHTQADDDHLQLREKTAAALQILS